MALPCSHNAASSSMFVCIHNTTRAMQLQAADMRSVLVAASLGNAHVVHRATGPLQQSTYDPERFVHKAEVSK